MTVGVLLAVACGSDVAPIRRGPAPRILAPFDGETLMPGESVFAVVAAPETGTLRFRIGDRDVTGLFGPPGPRNPRMGGGELHVAWIDTWGWEDREGLTFSVESSPGTAAVQARFAIPHAELRMDYEVVEEQDGKEVPVSARITVVGVDGTPTPNLAQTSMAVVEPVGRENQRSFVETDTGRGAVGLPAGTYAVIASRGLSSSVDVSRVSGAGRHARRFVLRPVLHRDSAVTCDFHVHGLASGDSSLPPPPRLRSFRAGGVDVLVASDHNVIFDYGGDGSDLLTIAGIEAGLQVSGPRGKSTSIGHWNAWPLAPSATDSARPSDADVWPPLYAVPPLRDVEAHVLYDRLHPLLDRNVARYLPGGSRPALPVIQMNHPRGLESPLTRQLHRDRSYLQAMGYDPSQPLDSKANAFLLRRDPQTGTSNASFDAIELYNRASLALYREVRHDYFALLRSGFVFTATGNSDSHSVAAMPGGVPVNVVDVGALLPDSGGGRGAPPARIAALMAAVRAGRVVSTTGPQLDLQVSGNGKTVGPGSLVAAADGHLQARLQVSAPEWVPVQEVRWFVDGSLVATDELPDPVTRIRSRALQPGRRQLVRTWNLQRSFRLQTDGFLFVEAGERLPEMASEPPSTGIYGAVVPRHWSLAFANPVRVDADGDGRWRPPAAELGGGLPLPAGR